MEILRLYGSATINGGQIDGIISGDVVLNEGIVEGIDYRNGGTCTINSGTVNTILLGSNMNNITITIGNLHDTVNNNNPEIGNLEITTGDLAGITATIYFYNGIIKSGYFENDNTGYYGDYILRSGYKAQTSTEGTVLVNNL